MPQKLPVGRRQDGKTQAPQVSDIVINSSKILYHATRQVLASIANHWHCTPSAVPLVRLSHTIWAPQWDSRSGRPFKGRAERLLAVLGEKKTDRTQKCIHMQT